MTAAADRVLAPGRSGPGDDSFTFRKRFVNDFTSRLRGNAVIRDRRVARVRTYEWRDWSRVWHYPAGGRLMSVADDPLYPDRLDALEQTWQVWSQLGGSLSETQWSAASRCPGWDVACLYAHHSQFLLALSAPPPHAPEVSGQPQSAVQVLRAFNAPGGVASTAAPAVADQAVREAAQHKPAELAERFTGLGPVMIGRLRAARPDLIVPWPPVPSGVMLGEGLRIMLMEATIHLLDVQRALGQPPALPGTALAHTASLLAEVAQGVELIEAAAGRSATSPFPVLR